MNHIRSTLGIQFVNTTYISIATLIGTLVMAYPFILIGYNGLVAPAPLPVYLPNGFIYHSDHKRERGVPKAIYNEHRSGEAREQIIMGDVKNVMWQENTIYGFRRGLADEPYYYICTLGENCSETQHMTELEFIDVLKERGLPLYESLKAHTYQDLLWEQSKTDIGKKGG